MAGIGRERAQYQRGLVLGFTVAESMLLILFALLLALGAILVKKDNQLVQVRQQMVALEEKFREAITKAEVLSAMVEKQPTDEFIRELVRAREAEAEVAREKEDLQRREHQLEEQSGLAKAVQNSPDKAKAIRDLAALGAHVKDEVAKSSKRGEDPYDVIPTAVAAADAARRAGYTPDEARDAFRNAAKAARDAATYRGQITKLRTDLVKAGKGGDFPPCWITESGQIEFLFDVALLSDGRLKVRDITPPNRVLDRRELNVSAALFADKVTMKNFLQLTGPLLDYEKAKDCRFFVMVSDLTGPAQKVTFKNLLLTVESRFYKVLKHSA
jgi:hypothetical protein